MLCWQSVEFFHIKTAFLIQINIDRFMVIFVYLLHFGFIRLVFLYFTFAKIFLVCFVLFFRSTCLFIHMTLLLLLFILCCWLLTKIWGKKQRIEQREKSINDWLFVNYYVDGLFVLAKQHCRMLCCICAACVSASV